MPWILACAQLSFEEEWTLSSYLISSSSTVCQLGKIGKVNMTFSNTSMLIAVGAIATFAAWDLHKDTFLRQHQGQDMHGN